MIVQLINNTKSSFISFITKSTKLSQSIAELQNVANHQKSLFFGFPHWSSKTPLNDCFYLFGIKTFLFVKPKTFDFNIRILPNEYVNYLFLVYLISLIHDQVLYIKNFMLVSFNYSLCNWCTMIYNFILNQVNINLF